MTELEPFPTGPYLTCAFLCETVLTEADGVNTYIRVVDKFQRTVSVRGEGLSPEELREQAQKPYDLECTLVLTFRAGQAEGMFGVEIALRLPSGLLGPSQTVSVPLGASSPAVNMHMPTVAQLEDDGRYAFEISVENRLLGEVAFLIQRGWLGSGGVRPGPQ